MADLVHMTCKTKDSEADQQLQRLQTTNKHAYQRENRFRWCIFLFNIVKLELKIQVFHLKMLIITDY